MRGPRRCESTQLLQLRELPHWFRTSAGWIVRGVLRRLRFAGRVVGFARVETVCFDLFVIPNLDRATGRLLPPTRMRLLGYGAVGCNLNLCGGLDEGQQFRVQIDCLC